MWPKKEAFPSMALMSKDESSNTDEKVKPTVNYRNRPLMTKKIPQSKIKGCRVLSEMTQAVYLLLKEKSGRFVYLD